MLFSSKNSKQKSNANARIGLIKTSHGEIETPVFMPVGTKATVKTLSQNDLKNLNAQIILANTYHLYLRPGEKLIKKMGGLHKWMNFKSPILTDSGGFQVFSLGEGKGFNAQKNFKTTVKICDDGVEFKSFLDGSKHFITPEKAIQIQHDLGADIIMAFDECTSAKNSKERFGKAMERTHKWAIKCKKEHTKLSKKHAISPALFGIVQGGIYKDLRKKSAKFINDLNFDGNAIGGLAVGEDKKTMYKMIETVVPLLDRTKPIYLMGVGTPEDILEAVERGVDMFGCVHPTRMARHGAFWTNFGRFSIKNERFKTDPLPLQKGCKCETCQTYSRSYLRHLTFEKEILGMRLMTIHNVYFLLNFMAEIRKNIKKGNFLKFKKNFLKKFKK